MINALEWLRDSGDQPFRPVYVVFGDDSYLIRESIRAVNRALFGDADRDASISRFAGPVTPLANVLDEVSTLPFFSRRRLVIVEEADTFVTKHRKDLEAICHGDPSELRGLTLAASEVQWPAEHNLWLTLVENVGPRYQGTRGPEATASSPRG